MKPFHQSTEWRNLAKEHKTLRCKDCGSDKDIQSGHILAAKRFPMAGLWKSNLKHQCKPCNLKQGTKLQINLTTLKLLGLYYMIKLLKYGLIGLVAIVLMRYVWLDINGNHSIITDQIQHDFVVVFEWIADRFKDEAI